LWVASHPNAPFITLKILAHDKDPEVSIAAKRNPKYIARVEKESVNVEWDEKEPLANTFVKPKKLLSWWLSWTLFFLLFGTIIAGIMIKN
jgi:hypothetical protein